MVRPDILPDPICPSCCSGTADLDRAPGRLAGHPVPIAGPPFRRNPDTAPGGAARGAAGPAGRRS
jgi:predicted DsbA family dithiol-disulfide isomerase